MYLRFNKWFLISNRVVSILWLTSLSSSVVNQAFFFKSSINLAIKIYVINYNFMASLSKLYLKDKKIPELPS